MDTWLLKWCRGCYQRNPFVIWEIYPDTFIFTRRSSRETVLITETILDEINVKVEDRRIDDEKEVMIYKSFILGKKLQKKAFDVLKTQNLHVHTIHEHIEFLSSKVGSNKNLGEKVWIRFDEIGGYLSRLDVEQRRWTKVSLSQGSTIIPLGSIIRSQTGSNEKFFWVSRGKEEIELKPIEKRAAWNIAFRYMPLKKAYWVKSKSGKLGAFVLDDVSTPDFFVTMKRLGKLMEKDRQQDDGQYSMRQLFTFDIENLNLVKLLFSTMKYEVHEAIEFVHRIGTSPIDGHPLLSPKDHNEIVQNLVDNLNGIVSQVEITERSIHLLNEEKELELFLVDARRGWGKECSLFIRISALESQDSILDIKHSVEKYFENC